MSYYDGWMDDESEEEAESGCVVCGCGSRAVDGRYCSESCAAEDEGWFEEEGE
jgi:hypothetical protein